MARVLFKPDFIRVYTNTKKLTMRQVQKETGADLVFNGVLYSSSFKPVMNLKVDGDILSFENPDYLGYGWNEKLLNFTNKYTDFQNFITGIPLIRAGVPISPLSYPAELGGRRGRTALGVREDGSVLAFCSGDNTSDAMTLEQLRDTMLAEGCVTALNLDGGGSSQLCYRDIDVVKSSRVVYNYICMWGKPVLHAVQVGAFIVKDYAEAEEAKLKATGRQTFLVEK